MMRARAIVAAVGTIQRLNRPAAILNYSGFHRTMSSMSSPSPSTPSPSPLMSTVSESMTETMTESPAASFRERSTSSPPSVSSASPSASEKIAALSPSAKAAVAANFDSVVLSRGFCRTFDRERKIDPYLVESLLKLSQTAPSSFNMQPYKMILVQDDSVRETLADAMLGGNPQRVRDAPVTIVYLADKEPVRLAGRLMELETAAGTDPAYMRDLMVKINVLLGNGGMVAGKLRAIATEIASAISPSPVVHKNPASWAVKNTIFASQTFMLAATAHGLGTAPMEGFDERRLCYALNIPMDRYTVPLIVSIGYPAKVVKNYGGDKGKRRYPLEEMCFTDRFDNKWESTVKK